MGETLENQVKMLESMASSGVGKHIVLALGALGAATAWGAIHWQSPSSAFISALSLSVAAAVHAVIGKFKLAAKALREGKSTPGTVVLRQLTIHKRYEVTAKDATGCTWVFACQIAGWVPSEGVHYKATLHQTEGVNWPVLVKTESMLLYPLSKPTLSKVAT